MFVAHVGDHLLVLSILNAMSAHTQRRSLLSAPNAQGVLLGVTYFFGISKNST